MEITKNNLRYRLHYRLRKLGGRVDAKTRTVEVAYGEEIPPRAQAVVERLVSLGYGVQWVIDGGGIKKGKEIKGFKVFKDSNKLVIKTKRKQYEKYKIFRSDGVRVPEVYGSGSASELGLSAHRGCADYV